MKNTPHAQPNPDVPASSPCLMHELDPDGRPRVDPEQARDVARWRKVERERQIGARCALTAEHRSEQTLATARALDQILAIDSVLALSVYWPIRAEPDLRPWMATLSQLGVRVSLPVAVVLGQSLVFREWRPHSRLERGLWNIPYPADGAVVVPNVVIAPLVAFDAQCYRLGYGGGFFDRTLAMLSPRPLVIGVGYPSGLVSTIFPQPHDIPMDWIVAGSLDPIRRPESSA